MIGDIDRFCRIIYYFGGVGPMTEERFSSLEAKVGNLEIRVAITENNIDNINKKLDKIDTNISRLTWIVVGAVVAAVLKMVLSGGI